MPRVNLGRDPKQGKAEYRRRLIDGKAHFRGYGTQKALELALGKEPGYLSKRYKGRVGWSADDYLALDNVLQFNADELASLIRGR